MVILTIDNCRVYNIDWYSEDIINAPSGMDLYNKIILIISFVVFFAIA